MAMTHEVHKGDIILSGSAFIHVTSISEDTVGMGLSFGGNIFDSRSAEWKVMRLPVFAAWGATWNVLSDAAKRVAGFDNL